MRPSPILPSPDKESYCPDSQGLSEKMKALEGVIRASGEALPVRVTVDQTGYAKYLESGMYILDGRGGGFELDFSELSQLAQRGIVRV